MRIVLKIALSIVAFFILVIINGLITDNGRINLMLSRILGLGMFAAIVAVWRYNPEKKKETALTNIDETPLNKK